MQLYGTLKAGDSTNNFNTESDGTPRFDGAATMWDDLRLPLYARTGGTPPTFSSGFAGNANLYAWRFAFGATNNMYFEAQMPHGWNGGQIFPHVHWAPTTTNTGIIRWIWEITWVNINGTFGASQTYNCDSTIATASQWKNIVAGGSGLTPTVSQNIISSCMVGRLYRVGSGAFDTYPDPAALVSIDIHYQLDTIASRQEFIK